RSSATLAVARRATERDCNRAGKLVVGPGAGRRHVKSQEMRLTVTRLSIRPEFRPKARFAPHQGLTFL
ncbi:hypothetical protein, partial [Pantoea ananatis]|uniref:hypothetical protein n=1 Tax=Pantoea ananas TaxID=553 RepID=UPI001B304B28